MAKIKNKYYNRFLKDGYLDTELLDEKELQKGLERIKHKNLKQARSYVILQYYSGARPNELLKMKAKDIYKDKKNPLYLIAKIPGSKRGLARKLEFKLKNPLIKELFEYAIGLYGEVLLFHSFITNHKRTHKCKNGEIKTYDETTAKIRYYFKKWFPQFPPYYFRHHRFSRLLDKGAKIEDIRQMKGARDIKSVFPYSHMSKRSRRFLANIND